MSPVLLFLLSCLLGIVCPAQPGLFHLNKACYVMLQPLQKLDVFVLDREPGKVDS